MADSTRTCCWSETAYEWWQQSQRIQLAQSTTPPQTPMAAAWFFFRPTSTSTRQNDDNNQNNTNHSYSGGTGLEFIDAALRKRPISSSSSSPLMVLDIRGSVGKTWTILSLAARFVVATRPSRFRSINTIPSTLSTSNIQPRLPQVLLFNARYDITIPKLVYAIRANLLRSSSSSNRMHHPREEESSSLGVDDHYKNTDDWMQQLDTDIQECLSRIHIVQVNTPSEWVPILECIRHALHSRNNHHSSNNNNTNPSSKNNSNQNDDDAFTLILWDGFLHGIPGSDPTRMEIVRQIERLLESTCSVSSSSSPMVWVSTTSSTTTTTNSTTDSVQPPPALPRQYEQFITHRIRLEKRPPPPSSSSLEEESTTTSVAAANSSPYVAHVHGSSYPFHITTAGILS